MPTAFVRVLLPLALLPAVGCGAKNALLSMAGGDAYVETAIPQPLPPAVVQAWTAAGGVAGWMRPSAGTSWTYRSDGVAGPGDVPAFRFRVWRPGVLAGLPPPAVPFGLHLASNELVGGKSDGPPVSPAQQVTDAGLGELVGFTNLKALALGSTPVTDAGLKELAGLRLWSLDLNNTGVGDDGLRHLAGQRALCSLNLYAAKVTDGGLVHLAGLTSLRALGFGSSDGLTAEGVRELEPALPRCKITTWQLPHRADSRGP